MAWKGAQYPLQPRGHCVLGDGGYTQGANGQGKALVTSNGVSWPVLALRGSLLNWMRRKGYAGEQRRFGIDFRQYC